MMTIHKIYQLSAPAVLWSGSVAAFAGVLGLGVVILGSLAEAQPTAARAAAVAVAEGAARGGTCQGVLFRDEDPLCFAVRAAPAGGPAVGPMIGPVAAPTTGLAPGNAGS